MKKMMIVLSMVLVYAVMATSAMAAYKIGEHLIAGPSPLYGLGIEITEDIASLPVSFLFEDAWYRSDFGWFLFNDDLSIVPGEGGILWSAVNDDDYPIGLGTPPYPTTKYITGLEAGDNLGFWLNPNGTANTPWYTTDNNHETRVQTIVSADMLSIIFNWEDLMSCQWINGEADWNDFIVRVGAPLPVAGVTAALSSILAGPFVYLRRRRF